MNLQVIVARSFTCASSRHRSSTMRRHGGDAGGLGFRVQGLGLGLRGVDLSEGSFRGP